MTSKRLHRAGSPWRILVHEWVGKKSATSATYGVSHHVTNLRSFGGGGDETSDSPHSRVHELSGTEFDELVIGEWIHLEQMDNHSWWMNVGGVTLWVRADRDGKPTSVTVYGPNDYAHPVDGVKYECAWTDVPAQDGAQ